MHHQHRHPARGVVERAPEPALTTVNGQVMSVVYVTQQPTFTGVIGGFSTLGSEDASTAQSAQATDLNSQPSQALAPTSAVVQAQPSASSQSIASIQSIQSAPNAATSAVVFSSTALAATSLIASSTGRHSASYTNTAIAGAATTSASSNSHSSSSSDGMSMGAKTGLAVGIICAIGVLAAILLLLLARKRKQKQVEEAKAEAEKSNQNRSAAIRPTDPETANAPQLSLRPVSKLTPEFMGGNGPRNRTSQGNMLSTMTEKDAFGSGQAQRPQTAENPFKDPENPFADPEKAAARTAVNNTRLAPTADNRGPMMQPAVSEQRTSGPTAESFPMPQPQSVNSAQDARPMPAAAAPMSLPRGPKSTHTELAAPAPVVAQGPGPDMPAGNVYRILMDFKPNMEDELELRAGQLVRVLHEYDDGWALCIRLDRSQQGVVPRTCLAAKPSKPRPGPAPGNGPSQPGSRPITPQGRPRGPPGPMMASPRGQGQPPSRTQSPVQPMRTQSPGPVAPSASTNTGSFNQPPRPLSPGPRPPKQRSMSPGPYGAGGPKPMAPTQQRRRSNSAGAASVRNKRASPPGPSKLGPGAPLVGPDSPGLAI